MHIAAGVHRRHPPPSLSTDQVPANAAGYPITHGAPSRARIQSNGQRQCPCRAAEEACVTANTRLAHWEATKQAIHHPFWHAHQGEQPTRGQSRRRQQHGQEPARHTRVRTPHRQQHHPLIFKLAAHHWEQQCCSQPRARPLGDSRADSFHYLPDTPDPHFHTRGGQQPQKGHPNAIAASPWTGAPYWGVRPSPLRATTSHRCTAARRRRGIAAPSQPPSGNPTTPFFQAAKRPIATTHERHDHHHHHHHHYRDREHHSGTVADVLTSPCFRQGVALRHIPWIMREVRGNVAKVAVGPRTLLVCIK